MPRCAKDAAHLRVLFCCAVLLPSLPAFAQITFQSAIDRVLEHSPRVESAREEVKRARAALAVTKDIYIPSVVAGGGLGAASGITLTVPTIFTINAQSLVYSAQQGFYIRAAHSDLRAAQFALDDACGQAEEDAAITYVSLDAAEKRFAAVTDQYSYALKLVSIVQDRVAGRLDSDLQLVEARRTAVQLKLAKIRVENDIDSLREHLGELIGLPPEGLWVAEESIPKLPAAPDDASPRRFAESPGMQSAEENAKAKLQRGQGDSRYTWRPQVSFAAQYARISPIENVSEFYNIHGDYNTASIGVLIQFPFLDRVRSAAAAESTADALRTKTDLDSQRFDENQRRKNLLRSLPELAASAELAGLELQIAQNQLESTLVQMAATGGNGPVLTPKDEMDARMQERQKYLDLLDAELQLKKAHISYLGETGGLATWVHSSPPSGAAKP